MYYIEMMVNNYYSHSPLSPEGEIHAEGARPKLQLLTGRHYNHRDK